MTHAAPAKDDPLPTGFDRPEVAELIRLYAQLTKEERAALFTDATRSKDG